MKEKERTRINGREEREYKVKQNTKRENKYRENKEEMAIKEGEKEGKKDIKRRQE